MKPIVGNQAMFWKVITRELLTNSNILMILLTYILIPEIAHADTDDLWMNTDCKRDRDFVYSIGNGEGPTKIIANQAALLDARKNALICNFGGRLDFKSTTKESSHSADFTSESSITLNAENIDWSSFENIRSRDILAGEKYITMLHFRWKIEEIEKNRYKIETLEMEKNKNKTLSSEVAKLKANSEEKERRLKEKIRELNAIKKDEIELSKVRSEKDKKIAQLKKLKKNQGELDDEWISMVTQFGCDNTIEEIEKILGKPEKIEIWQGRIEKDPKDPKDPFAPYVVPLNYPVIYFFYNYSRFAFRVDFEEVQHTYPDGQHRVYGDIWYKNEARRRIILKVEKMKGERHSWFLCQIPSWDETTPITK